MQRDKGHLEGRVTVRGIVETAEELVPEMRVAGANLVVAIPHSGMATSHPDGLKEKMFTNMMPSADVDHPFFLAPITAPPLAPLSVSALRRASA